MPARCPPPVLDAAPVVQSTLVGSGWYCSRSSRFFSNPPLPRITPRRGADRALHAVAAAPFTPIDAAVLDDQVAQLGVVLDRDARRRSGPCAGRSRGRCPWRTSCGRAGMLTTRLSITRSMVSGPLIVRIPRLILRKSAWVTIRFAGAFVYGGCRWASSSPRKRASIGTGSTLRPRDAPAGLLGEVVGVLRHPVEPHRGVVADEVHHLGAAVDEGVAAHLGHDVADDRVEVALGLRQGRRPRRPPRGRSCRGSRPRRRSARSSRRSSRSSRPARCRGPAWRRPGRRSCLRRRRRRRPRRRRQHRWLRQGLHGAKL